MENIQAFPMDYAHEGYRMEQGMTLRDYFANSAMQGLISNFKGDVSANYEIIPTKC